MQGLDPQSASTLESRREKALAILSPLGQSHVFQDWDRLNEGQRENLLQQVESVNWAHVHELYDRLVLKGERPIELSSGRWVPAIPTATEPQPQADQVGR